MHAPFDIPAAIEGLPGLRPSAHFMVTQPHAPPSPSLSPPQDSETESRQRRQTTAFPQRARNSPTQGKQGNPDRSPHLLHPGVRWRQPQAAQTAQRLGSCGGRRARSRGSPRPCAPPSAPWRSQCRGGGAVRAPQIPGACVGLWVWRIRCSVKKIEAAGSGSRHRGVSISNTWGVRV